MRAALRLAVGLASFVALASSCLRVSTPRVQKDERGLEVSGRRYSPVESFDQLSIVVQPDGTFDLTVNGEHREPLR